MLGGVGDMDCKRIHKEKKMQRAKFLFHFSKREKGLGVEISSSPEGWGL